MNKERDNVWSAVTDGVQAFKKSINKPRYQEPRTLTEDDVQDMLKAAGVRKPSMTTRQKQARLLKLHNFVRWNRMQSDFKWAKKVLKKNGYDPEEVRFLL